MQQVSLLLGTFNSQESLFVSQTKRWIDQLREMGQGSYGVEVSQGLAEGNEGKLPAQGRNRL